MYSMLSGLRVVECASFIAAPSCALHLQQLGAKVIRIDPIGGGLDFHRWPVSPEGRSFYWEGLNKGKQSIAIDLSRPEGRTLAVELITAPGRGAGLFVTNFPKDGFLAHHGLRKRRPDLISVRVTGWSDGELGGRLHGQRGAGPALHDGRRPTWASGRSITCCPRGTC